MTAEQIEICDKAVFGLRHSDKTSPFRSVRLHYADQIEMQTLIGNPEYDEKCVSLCNAINDAIMHEDDEARYKDWKGQETEYRGGL